MSHSLNVTTAALLCIYLACMQMTTVRTEIYKRSVHHGHVNSIVVADMDNSIAAESDDIASQSQAPPLPSSIVNTDLMDKMSWRCANNASCLYALANSIFQSYKRGETVKLGFVDLVKVPPSSKDKSKSKSNKGGSGSGKATETGRGISTFVDFVSGNAIRIPVGPMVFSVQRDVDDGDYIEVALLKKAAVQGRRNGGDDGGGGGLLGGGGGGGLLGGGGGGGGGGGIGGLLGGGGGGGDRGGGHRHRKHQEKKQFQMFIPMYLAATTFGWTMVAAKAVGLLTLKALAISKLAFVVAAMVIIKKLMDNASDKMMYQYPEHSPYMMPYSMDYPMHGMGGAEMSTGDMYPAAMHMTAGAQMAHQGHPGYEGLGAESNLHHNIADAHNNTQVLAALNAAGLGQKVKREDSWMAKRRKEFPLPHLYDYKGKTFDKTPYHVYPAELHNGQAMALAAAAAVVEDEDKTLDDDDIFNEEESVKETLAFWGLEVRKKKK